MAYNIGFYNGLACGVILMCGMILAFAALARWLEKP